MVKKIQLSQETKSFVNQINALAVKEINLPGFFNSEGSVAIAEIGAWLGSEIELEHEEARYLLESLHLAVLIDLRKGLFDSEQVDQEPSNKDWKTKLKFALLIIAGIIFFSCEGFDQASAIQGIFLFSPSPLILSIFGFIFSIFTVFIFYGLDLMELSDNLGVKTKNISKIIDSYITQLDEINIIVNEIDKTYVDKESEELDYLLELLTHLSKRYDSITVARTKIKAAFERPGLKIARTITTVIGGVIFLIGGFFAGQNVSLLIASIFITSMSPVAWPIIVSSVIVALCALLMYWHFQYPGIENGISRWVGLDKEKIDRLCQVDESLQNDMMQRLHQKVTKYVCLLKENAKLKQNRAEVKIQATDKFNCSGKSKPLRKSQSCDTLLFFKPLQLDDVSTNQPTEVEQPSF